MATAQNRMLWLGVILAVIVSDQLTKWLILSNPAFNAVPCLDVMVACGKIELSSVFDLTMLWNRGISFGTLQSDGIMRWVLVLATTGIAAGFTYWLFRAERWLTALSLALVIGGAIGNLIDRIRFGAVVDFLDFSGPWFGAHIANWPIGFPWVFNIADAGITVGAVLLFLDQFLMSRNETGEATGV
ncbi:MULTISPECIES: signal peptidase II [Henriciella]|jgi:signal peptidase II|uniref:Lipoprotein signal peptidase n=3 Tax=Henriciella pelagia TaxID=1977912 RepID=A0ABQ1JGC8_9PROT|nr:signal peptidase II [Henriciella pelagia]GGB66510.1 lipoprotein signal peptidase [Henriciella pelagia]